MEIPDEASRLGGFSLSTFRVGSLGFRFQESLLRFGNLRTEGRAPMSKQAAVLLAIACLVWGWVGCSRERAGGASGFKFVSQDGGFRVESPPLALECGRDLGLRTFLRKNGKWITVSSRGELPAVTSLRASGPLPSSARRNLCEAGCFQGIVRGGMNCGPNGLAITWHFGRIYKM